MNRTRVVIGLLGTKLDQPARRGDRWKSWRPSVSVCQQSDMPVDRIELLHENHSDALLQQVAKDIRSASPSTEVSPRKLNLRDPWDFEEVYAELHQFARDYPFDTDNEEYLIHITTGTHVIQICLFLLTESRHLPGSLLQSSPSRGTPKNPAGSARVIDLDLSRYDQLASRFYEERQESVAFLKSGIETRDAKFNRLIERIEQVSLATVHPILLTGPTGAGKSQLAKRIFELKRQRQQVAGELVEVNCATIRGDQAMSALFGHSKGAFTGALSARDGLLKSADSGVLFLDEIGELGLDEQASLLHAIEEKTFLPVGSDQPVKSDFQLIAGTNRDLAKAVTQGRFRDDLLARINLWSFELPGLAQRRDDIDPNIDFELQKYANASGNKVTMNKEARARFLAFAMKPESTWAANFRDLNAAVTRMATLASGGRISPGAVDEEIERLEKSWSKARKADAPDVVLSTVFTKEEIEEIDHFDRVQLAKVIEVCRSSSSLSAAGRALFQVSRQAKQKPNDADRLRKYLGKFGLDWSGLQANTK